MKVIGHRGGTPNHPENTMAAFHEAQRLGADGIEFDVQQCSDGALVVIHDFTLDQTTNGTGLVGQTTSDHVASLDAGSWHSERFAGERVPLLAEVLQLDGVDFELELKGYGRTFLQSVLGCVAEQDAFGRIEFTSSNVPLLGLLKAQHPEAQVGFFSQPKHPSLSDEAFEHYIVGVASTAPFDIAHVNAKFVSPSIVERLHGLGMAAHANDAMNAEDVQRALDAGADKLSANDVGMARSVVDRVTPP